MLDSPQLLKAVANIARIEEAGLTEELWGDIHEATKHMPAGNDLDNCSIGQRVEIERLASLSERILRVPYDDCLAAATSVSMTTRSDVILRIIAAFIAQLDGTTPAEPTSTGTPAAIERARGPR